MPRLVPVLGFLLLCGSARAAAPPQSLAPFLDDESIAVVRLDLTRIDIPKTITRLLGPLDAPSRTPSGTFAAQVLATQRVADELRKAGASELFLILGINNSPAASSAVVPIAEGADATRIGELLCGKHTERPLQVSPAFAVMHGAVFAGTQEAIERVKRNDPKTPIRPGLAEALNSGNQGELQIALAPTADQRKILEEMIPTLPRELGGGPITTLTKGMNWGLLDASFGPKSSLRATVQATDALAASDIKGLATTALKAAGQKVGQQNKNLAKFLDGIEIRIAGDRLTSDLDLDQFASFAMTPVVAMRAAATRSQCMNNLKQIMLAMHNYHDKEKSFPPAFKANGDGKPLLSWRVLILPYLDQNELYKEFHLDEPWDSPHNKTLIERIPAVYQCPSQNLNKLGIGKTTYVTPRGKSTMFSGAIGTKIKDIYDGTSNTIAVVDVGADRAVTWTAPEDWEVEKDPQPKSVLKGHGEGSTAGFADGSARFIKDTIDAELLRHLTTHRGGEVIPLNNL